MYNLPINTIIYIPKLQLVRPINFQLTVALEPIENDNKTMSVKSMVSH